mgnify:FL=1|jgi:hypothetical protein
MIEGVKVPKRTSDESRHMEALLRNKIEKLKKKLDEVRQENSNLKTALEKERGRSEYYRRNRIEAGSD